LNPAFSVDPYLSRVYQNGQYTCSEFAREVWLDLTGEDIAERLKALFRWGDDRHVAVSGYRSFTRLDTPESPCIALMRRARTVPHMGIYLRRRILHLTEAGAAFQRPEMAALTFKTLRYYR
jgi:hypothetical protein